MCKLTYEELILLDNLIYLQWDVNEDEKLINIVSKLLNSKEFDKLMDSMRNCIIKMTESEWVNILDQILNKPNLRNLRIKNVESYKSGMKFACFVDDENNATVIFRGTTNNKEWEDNGEGAYKYDTMDQIESLKYINNLEYDNITVTGHSKGGNKAQYVAILSPKIIKCVSINGQGFSNEFISKYKEEINNNKSKIICINAKYDYVNCLFNSITEKCQYVKTEVQINPLDYHKANILLDENGDLRQKTDKWIFCEVINNYSISLISDLPEDMQNLIINGIIEVIELILCKGESNMDFLRVAGEYLIMFCYENYFKCKEIFNIGYEVLAALSIPLLFWNDFVRIEETKSKELLSNAIEEIKILGNERVKRIKIIDKNQVNLINSISKAINDLTFKLQNEILK